MSRALLLLFALAGCSFPHGEAARAIDAAESDAADASDAAADALPDGRITDAATCPSGFVTVAGAPATSKYKVFAAQPFAGAVNGCKAMGTHLLELDTQGEANALYTFIDVTTTALSDTHLYRVVGQRNKSVTPNTWLGLSGETLTFLPFGVGEPTNGAGEDCIDSRLETSGPGTGVAKVIGADVCTTNHEYACECE